MTNRTMRTKIGWRLMECVACGISKSANQWLCRCNIPWYTCWKHSSPWFDPIAGPRTNAKCRKKVISHKPFWRKKPINKHMLKTDPKVECKPVTDAGDNNASS